MDISYKWLKRFIDFNLSPADLAATLTSLGLECDSVEEVESIRGGLRGVVIGKVLTCEPHPDSDHLHVTTVDLGQDQPVQIVCGAPNVAAGQTVVVATIGTKLYDGDKEFQIKKSKIRGVESFGMICAEDELGLGNSHDGIMVLPDDVKPGTPAAEYFKVESDYRLEVELTPNRVDAASHYGTARDLKAWLWRNACEGNPKSELPEVSLPDVSSFAPDRNDGFATIEVLDHKACPRYSGVTIRGVKVQESPEWLKTLLTAAGQRPINNIVDITNYVLLGIGQPLHCFDLDKVKGEKIVVRTCPAGTKFTTLDGVERILHEADLMICNESEPMCIAGIFGGLESGVTEKTTDVFIESAWFNPTSIRRTARRHGLSTDASFRYERGTDPLITPYAARLAAVMIKELAGGEICGDVLDVYPEPVKPVEIDFSIAYCNALIGKEIPRELIVCILKALEINVEETADADGLKLRIPPYRVDVTRPCDVVEEILRVYGYNNVEINDEMHVNLSQKGDTDRSHRLEQIISDMLTAQGFVEIMNNSLSAASYYADNEKYKDENCVKVMNPLSGDLSVMRRTLLYGGLESLAHNINRKAVDLRMYEFGNVYELIGGEASSAEKPLAPYAERHALGIWLTGKQYTPSWNMTPLEADVFLLKAEVLAILKRLGVSEKAVVISQESDSIFSSALVFTNRNKVKIAELGILRREILKKFDIHQAVCYAEIDWNAVLKMAAGAVVKFAELPKTMAVRRDLALLLNKDVAFSKVEDIVRKNAGKMLREVSLFDVYEGKNLPAGKKSYAIAIMLQDPEKTLQDRQIEAVMKKVIDALTSQLGAELR